ncbi:Mediator of RNA polymerase II transcription subunit 16 [Botryosphaeria dothidea]
MMEDDQYMDLFNEAEQIPIAVPTPPVKKLAQRLDELGESGCCQKIAWSKSGCVASITRDGRGVNLRAFQRNPTDGKWVLGDEAPLQIPSVHEEFPLVHVSWGHLGVDLAVVDAAGRILVYTAAQAADRMKLSREPFSDHESESNALVGLHWLPVAPQQVKYHMIWSADRQEDKWQYRMTSHPWKEPHNPVHPRLSLGAFVCFTRGGTVRLLFQQPDQQCSTYSLHSGYDQLTAKKKPSGSVGQRQKTNLKRLPDVVLGSATLGFFSLDFHTKFALYQSTGGVEFRDRYSMDIITADLNENKVSSLPQAGFSFTATDPALVLQYSSASLQYMPGDDLFAIMPADMDNNLKRLFLRGTHQCMNVVADYPPEDASQKSFEAIFRNNVLRGCLSTQNLLGMTANGSRNVSSKLAWITLNLRFTSFLLSIPTNQARGGGPESFTMGLLKWTVDLMIYVMNDLIELANECKKHEADRGFVQKKVQERCSPGLFLLLCSFPRAIFRVTRQPLQLLLTISQWHIKNAPTVVHRSVFNGLLAAMISSPVHPPHLAALVAEVDNSARLCYNKAQYTDERRRATEREMLISAEIPDVLMPVVTRLLTHGIEKLLESVDPAKILYWDLRWLGLTEDKREKQFLEKNAVDVLRKIVISGKEGRRRRCVRCGSEMEDMEWMGGQNKCACGSPWAMGSFSKK